MTNIPKPITRKDMYYSYLINGSGELPEPITRQDQYLYYLCVNGFGGGGTVTPEMIDEAVSKYLEANPVSPGATPEQAAQIQENANAISDIVSRLDENDKGSMTEEEMLDFLYGET